MYEKARNVDEIVNIVAIVFTHFVANKCQRLQTCPLGGEHAMCFVVDNMHIQEIDK